jgi:hypothetical protein
VDKLLNPESQDPELLGDDPPHSRSSSSHNLDTVNDNMDGKDEDEEDGIADTVIDEDLSEEGREMENSDVEEMAENEEKEATIAATEEREEIAPEEPKITQSLDESLAAESAEILPSFSESMDVGNDQETGLLPEGSTENQPPTKKRKKRTPAILRDLEITPQQVAEAAAAVAQQPSDGNEAGGDEKNESGGRYASSRTAAKVAKTKFNSGKARDRSTSDAQNTTGTAGTKPGRKSNAAKAQPVAEIQWIGCDDCAKWRSIPIGSGINVNDLADKKWVCSMNTWDEKRASCEAEEEQYQATSATTTTEGEPILTGASIEGGDEQQQLETQSSVAAAMTLDETAERPPQIADKDLFTTKSEKATPSTKGRGKGKKKVALQDGDEVATPHTARGGGGEDNANVPATASGRKKGAGGGKGSSSKATAAALMNNQHQLMLMMNNPELLANGVGPDGLPLPVNWVQCNRCKKWRKVPGQIDISVFPEKWFCHFNRWAPQYASCNVKQEEDDSNENSTHNVLLQHPTNRGGGGTKKGQANLAAVIANASAAAQALPAPGQTVIKKIQWVQCEKKGCKKWRKVPAHIDMSVFPEKWFCDMNTWNLDAASHDVPEDSDSENEDTGADTRAQSIILSNSKSMNTLSYRRIIYGNDGKIKLCFSDKNKIGFGLFSSVLQVPKRSYDLFALQSLGNDSSKIKTSEAVHADGASVVNPPEGEPEEEEDEEILVPMKKISFWWSSAYKENQLKLKYSPKEVENSENSFQEIPKEIPYQSTPLLDAASRNFFHEPTNEDSFAFEQPSISMQPKFSYPKKLSKSWPLLQSLTLFQRFKAECTIIRSAFVASNQQQLSFHSLYTFIMNKCRFHHPLVECVREYLTEELFKDALRRMEEKDEVEILFTCLTTPMEMIIHLLTTLPILRGQIAAKSKIFHRKVNPPTFGMKWSKTGVPLKMRKFYLKNQALLNSFQEQQRIQQQQLQQQQQQQFKRQSAKKQKDSSRSEKEKRSAKKSSSRKSKKEEIEEEEEGEEEQEQQQQQQREITQEEEEDAEQRQDQNENDEEARMDVETNEGSAKNQDERDEVMVFHSRVNDNLDDEDEQDEEDAVYDSRLEYEGSRPREDEENELENKNEAKDGDEEQEAEADDEMNNDVDQHRRQIIPDVVGATVQEEDEEEADS